jgi:cysteine desulfurase/selenocysteine lyase
MSASTGSARSPVALDVEAVRREFPVLRITVHGRPLVYLDSAASAQKPQVVIDAERDVY